MVDLLVSNGTVVLEDVIIDSTSCQDQLLRNRLSKIVRHS